MLQNHALIGLFFICSRFLAKMGVLLLPEVEKPQPWNNNNIPVWYRVGQYNLKLLANNTVFSGFHYQKGSQNPFPCPMEHRSVPISISIALGHSSANAVKAIAGGWSTCSSVSLNCEFPTPFSYVKCQTRRQWVPFLSLWYHLARARTHDLLVVRQMLYHWAITLMVSTMKGPKFMMSRALAQIYVRNISIKGQLKDYYLSYYPSYVTSPSHKIFVKVIRWIVVVQTLLQIWTPKVICSF